MQNNLNPVLAAAVMQDARRAADARRLARSASRGRTGPSPFRFARVLRRPKPAPAQSVSGTASVAS